MSRKETPDILGTLMGRAVKNEDSATAQMESPKAIKPESNKAINRSSNKAVSTASNKLPVQLTFNGEEVSDRQQDDPAGKEKATFNLSKKVLRSLEDSWMEIRRLRGDKRISKTDIVEQAIEDAIKEFTLKRQISKFYGKLESNKAIKQ